MGENDRRRILDLLAAGKISVDDAANLLRALAGGGRPAPPPLEPPPRTSGRARLLRITVDAREPGAGGETTKVRVNVPLALARFATRFLPPEARADLEAQGIDLNEILAALDEDLPGGKLVDVDVGGDDSTTGAARVIIEAL